jgi:predicted enzyme related to lactoylglutathione lyase
MTFQPKDFLVWGEIPVSDLRSAVQFYEAVTGAALEVDENGSNPMVFLKPADMASGVALHLYPGRPSHGGAGPTLHIAANGTAEEVMERVKSAGGQVVSEPIQIPAGRFFYAIDPDGNSVGFFERME